MASWTLFGGSDQTAFFTERDREAEVEWIRALVVRLGPPQPSVSPLSWLNALRKQLMSRRGSSTGPSNTSPPAVPPGWNGSVGSGARHQEYPSGDTRRAATETRLAARWWTANAQTTQYGSTG